MPGDFRLPNDDEHIAIVGRNGSGKTQAATWILSGRSWQRKPWFVMNFKGDDLINEIPHTRPQRLTDRLPKQAGIYIINQVIADKKDQEDLDTFFRNAWNRENVGIFVDEGYMASGLKWFRACLTQGRSRRVSLMVLSQRPVWMDRFVWSEASQYMAFDLNIQDDKDTTAKMIPGYGRVKLPRFHSIWHDVKADTTLGLTPVPERASILQRFRDLAIVQRRAI